MSGKVSAWLEGLGLGQYAAAFEENDIGWDLINDIDQETLKDIGIGSAGHRLKILKAASNLHSDQVIAASTASKPTSPRSTIDSGATDDISSWSRTPGERKPVTMLAEGSVGHNHLDFYEDAMEGSLRMAEWDEVDRYAQALEDYTRPEPLPRCEFLVARGRALAAHGRGNRDRASVAELQRLHDEAESIGLKFVLPALEAALASS